MRSTPPISFGESYLEISEKGSATRPLARPISSHHTRVNVLVYYGPGQGPSSFYHVPVEDLWSVDL